MFPEILLSAVETTRRVTLKRKDKTSLLTSMTVHCSTTMASNVGAAVFCSPSLASWKMKTLSTDLGSKSAGKEDRKEKKPAVKKSIYWMECVCLVSVRPSRPEEMEWYQSATFAHNPLLHSQWCGPFVWAMCTLYIMQGDGVKERGRYSPSGMFKKKRRGDITRYISVFSGPQSPAGFHAWQPNRG